MNATHAIRRPLAAALLALFAVTTLAPAAFAGHSSYRVKNARGPVRVQRVVRTSHYAPAPRVVVHESNAGAVFAGIVGGLILGTAIANAAQPIMKPAYTPVYAPAYRYYDPYCRVTFATLDDCRGHFRYHGGPYVVRVVEVSSGRWVHSYEWNGGWHDWHGDRGCND
jgi:hypothetical protein